MTFMVSFPPQKGCGKIVKESNRRSRNGQRYDTASAEGKAKQIRTLQVAKGVVEEQYLSALCLTQEVYSDIITLLKSSQILISDN